MKNGVANYCDKLIGHPVGSKPYPQPLSHREKEAGSPVSSRHGRGDRVRASSEIHITIQPCRKN